MNTPEGVTVAVVVITVLSVVIYLSAVTYGQGSPSRNADPEIARWLRLAARAGAAFVLGVWITGHFLTVVGSIEMVGESYLSFDRASFDWYPVVTGSLFAATRLLWDLTER